MGAFSEIFTVSCAGLEREVESRAVMLGGWYLEEISASLGTVLLADQAEAKKKRERFCLNQRGTKLLAFAFKIAVSDQLSFIQWFQS